MNTLFPLAYTPFIDPIDLHRYWFVLIIPLSLGIALAYKAVRVHDLKTYPRQVLAMTLQIILAMIGLGAASYLFVQHIVPLITSMP